MSDDLEDRLRSALRPVDPGDEFTQRVLSRVARRELLAEERAPALRGDVSTSPRPFERRMLWLSAALAATLALAALGVHSWLERNERAAGLEAREQLMEALRITSEKLDLAHEAVNSQMWREVEEKSGA